MTGIAKPISRTLAGALDEIAARQGDHAAILYEGETLSYAELRDASMAVAKSLLALGIRPGDRVGALLGNQPEWVMMAMGAAYVGAVFVPFNTWYKRAEIDWTLRHCGLSCFVCLARFLKQDFAQVVQDLFPNLGQATTGARALEGYPMLKAVVMLGGELPGALTWNAFLALGAGRTTQSVHAALAAVRPDDIAYILYTSGSTAEPKGVMLAHGGVVGNGWDIGARRWVTAEDRVWLGSPLFYALGATNALPVTFTRGATLVLQGAFDAGKAIRVIEQTQSTVYYGTGNMTRAILDHPEYRQSRIGSLQKGNAGTMTEYKRMTLIEMGMSQACAAYGLTESYGQAMVGNPDDPLEVKLHTNGHALPGFEVSIVDPQTGRALRTGEIGLVLLKGYTTPGYYRNEEENARTLRPDGYFDTGDLGAIDSAGRLLFHARMKEVIKTGGINVSPLEIEQLLVQHPHIRDAHVIGVPNAARGQLIVAFVDADRVLAEREVREFIRERAASFKVPHHVLFRTTAQLPRVATGKVAKHRLLEEARDELGL